MRRVKLTSDGEVRVAVAVPEHHHVTGALLALREQAGNLLERGAVGLGERASDRLLEGLVRHAGGVEVSASPAPRLVNAAGPGQAG